MKPPICEQCGNRFPPEEGGLVRFAPTPESEAWRARAAAEPGFVGHPPDLAWFCGTHLAAAQALADDTLDAALRSIGDRDAALLERATRYARSLGVEPLPELTASTSRRWDEMDGCVAPDCPFVDEHVLDGAGAQGRVQITRTEAWWNDGELANSSTTISVWASDGRHLGTIHAADHR
jgi:hypothetical protein